MAAIDEIIAQLASNALDHYKAGRHDDAIDAFTKAIEQQDSAVLRKNRAAVKAAQQDWTGAEADLTAALATDPPDALRADPELGDAVEFGFERIQMPKQPIQLGDYALLFGKGWNWYWNPF